MTKTSDELHNKRNLKLHSNKFCSKYPRIKRKNLEFSDKTVPEWVKKYPHPFEKSPDSAYVSVKEAPFPGFIHIHYFDIMNILPIYNRILVYRLLRL